MASTSEPTSDRQTRHDVRILDWNAARPVASRIRTVVFVEEQGVPPELEMDEMDAVCDHAIATAADGTPVATGRLLPDGHIGRMAVLASHRGTGVGRLVLEALLARARERGMREAILNAQTYACGFYARSGFVAEGAEFMEAGIPHRVMRLRLD